MKKMLKNMKKFILKNKIPLLLGLISIIAFIVGGILFDFLITGIVVAVVDLLLFLIPFIIKKFKGRKNKKPKEKKSSKDDSEKKTKPKRKKKWLKILLIIFFIGCILVLISVCVFFYVIVKNAPEFNPELLYQKEPSILYDNQGNLYAKLGSQNREKITYDETPEVLIDAIIATEDSRFFQHNGFDLPRFVKASIGQLSGNSAAGGASTLTMQVVKNTYTDASQDSGIKGIIRKFTDIYMAIFKLEKEYSKEEILEFYVNSYYMGGGAWGVEQASITYFGKSAKDLTLPEASLIAGLFQSPNTYNPFNNIEAATKRRSTVKN